MPPPTVVSKIKIKLMQMHNISRLHTAPPIYVALWGSVLRREGRREGVEGWEKRAKARR